jgi:hypothetical protein
MYVYYFAVFFFQEINANLRDLCKVNVGGSKDGEFQGWSGICTSKTHNGRQGETKIKMNVHQITF